MAEPEPLARRVEATFIYQCVREAEDAGSE